MPGRNRRSRGGPADVAADRERASRHAGACGCMFAKWNAIKVNPGSFANHFAVGRLDLPSGSEVFTPELTYATILAPIVRHGLVPSLVDVAPGTAASTSIQSRRLSSPEPVR